jgi:hypothetical protein
MKLSTRTIERTLVIIIFTIFAGYQFMSASAPANPPAQNAPAPLNVGATDQVKSAGLSVNSLLVSGNMQVTGSSATFNQVRATQYCDATGANCFTAATVGLSCTPMLYGPGGTELSPAERPDRNRYMFMPGSVSIRCKQLGYDFGYATNLFAPINAARSDGWCGFNNARTAEWVVDINGSRWVSTGCSNFSVRTAECCSL